MLPASVDPREKMKMLSAHPPRENSLATVPVCLFSIGDAATRAGARMTVMKDFMAKGLDNVGPISWMRKKGRKAVRRKSRCSCSIRTRPGARVVIYRTLLEFKVVFALLSIVYKRMIDT